MWVVTFYVHVVITYRERLNALDENHERRDEQNVNVRDLIVAEGDDARKLSEEKLNSRKVRFLKQGQRFRGRFLTTKFISFMQHSDYGKQIPSHACLDPKGKTNCPSCQAGVGRRLKFLVFWYDIDNDQIVVRDVSKSGMAAINAAVDQYGDDLLTDTFDISMGEKGTISILYVKPKKGEEFPPTPADIEIDDNLLAYAMGVRTEDEIRAMLADKVDQQGEDVKIERIDDGPAPGPIGPNGTELF